MIIHARPPNFSHIALAFPFADRPGVIFSWGEDIFNPSGVEIPGELLAHERAHGQRQLAPGMNPYFWWERYIEDPKFRLEEELAGHKAEYAAFKSHEHNARKRERMLGHIAEKFSSPLYGSMITQPHARRLLR